ncbi:uncharacterized protein LOC115882842 [Sitophilus oryzae]|uniref:Uncharacterized protein LOC115882842 n=1 Tax=Sitophilus oryzae TaxID=7048 RepID=A0A6J2Y0X2_SITOR|nr:uncharacterized protein LOC115882842 [Sitophilus oryzae]
MLKWTVLPRKEPYNNIEPIPTKIPSTETLPQTPRQKTKRRRSSTSRRSTGHKRCSMDALDDEKENPFHSTPIKNTSGENILAFENSPFRDVSNLTPNDSTCKRSVTVKSEKKSPKILKKKKQCLDNHVKPRTSDTSNYFKPFEAVDSHIESILAEELCSCKKTTTNKTEDPPPNKKPKLEKENTFTVTPLVRKFLDLGFSRVSIENEVNNSSFINDMSLDKLVEALLDTTSKEENVSLNTSVIVNVGNDLEKENNLNETREENIINTHQERHNIELHSEASSDSGFKSSTNDNSHQLDNNFQCKCNNNNNNVPLEKTIIQINETFNERCVDEESSRKRLSVSGDIDDLSKKARIDNEHTLKRQKGIRRKKVDHFRKRMLKMNSSIESETISPFWSTQKRYLSPQEEDSFNYACGPFENTPLRGCYLENKEILRTPFVETPTEENRTIKKCLVFDSDTSNSSSFADSTFKHSVVDVRGSLDLRIFVSDSVLYVNVIRCSDLYKPERESINAYIKVAISDGVSGTRRKKNGLLQRTPVQSESSKPTFNHTFRFPVTHPNDCSKRVHVEVWHRERITKTSEFLGCMSFEVKDAFSKVIEGSYRLLPQSEGRLGNVLISNEFVDSDFQVTCHRQVSDMGENSQEGCGSVTEEILSLDGIDNDLKRSSNKAILSEQQKHADENLFLRYLELDPTEGPDAIPAAMQRKATGNKFGRTPFTQTKRLVRPPKSGFGFSVVWTHPPRIERVEKGLPADRAGILPGDYIIFVDKNNVVMMPEIDILNLIRSYGSQLTLEIFRRNPSRNGSVPSMLQKSTTLIAPSSLRTDSNVNIPSSTATTVAFQPRRPSTVCSTNTASVDYRRRKLNLPQVTFSSEKPISNPEESRKRTMYQLIAKEQQYATALQFAITRFVSSLAERRDLITPSEHRILFQNCEELLRITEDILDHLVHEDGEMDTGLLCRVYRCKLHEMTSAYKKYCAGIKKADCVLASKMKNSNSDFVRFVQCPTIPRRRPDLTTFIHKPLEHYREVLKILTAVQGHTKSNHEDFPVINQIVHDLQVTYREITSEGGLMEPCGEGRPLLSVQDLENRLVFTKCKPFVLNKPGRQWIFGGDLSRVEGRNVRQYWTLLFSDMLLFAKASRDRVLFITEDPLPLVHITDMFFDVRKKENEFRICVNADANKLASSPTVHCGPDLSRTPRKNSNRKTVILRAPTTELKAVWQNLLQRQIFQLNSGLESNSLSSPMESPEVPITSSVGTLQSVETSSLRRQVRLVHGNTAFFDIPGTFLDHHHHHDTPPDTPDPKPFTKPYRVRIVSDDILDDDDEYETIPESTKLSRSLESESRMSFFKSRPMSKTPETPSANLSSHTSSEGQYLDFLHSRTQSSSWLYSAKTSYTRSTKPLSSTKSPSGLDSSSLLNRSPSDDVFLSDNVDQQKMSIGEAPSPSAILTPSTEITDESDTSDHDEFDLRDDIWDISQFDYDLSSLNIDGMSQNSSKTPHTDDFPPNLPDDRHRNCSNETLSNKEAKRQIECLIEHKCKQMGRTSFNGKCNAIHLEQWMKGQLDEAGPHSPVIEQLNEDWTEEMLRKRSEELQLIDPLGNITSYGDTRRHENKCEELTLSDQDEHSPSKSTTTESQVTVRSSPIVPETVQVCRQCHKNCLSNVIANNKLNQTNHVRDCNSNQQSNHLFNDHNHFSERQHEQHSKQKEDSDWQPLLLLGLCANPVASLVKMDPFQSAAPKISVAPPTPEHSMANGTIDCFEGEDKCPCDHINNCCPMDKTQSVYDPDISPDDSPQTEDHPYHSLTSSVLTLRRFGTVSSLERCGSEEREDNNRNHYSSEESDIDDDHDHDDDDEDLGIDNEAFQHSSIMSWTVKAGSYVAEKMAFFERLGKEICGTTKINKSKRQTAWWNDDIKHEIKMKKAAWKNYLCGRNMDKYEVYKKHRERVKQLMKQINDKNGILLMNEEDIIKRWKQYFEDLFEGQSDQKNFVVESRATSQEEDMIELEDVHCTIQKLKKGKAARHDGITAEMLKNMGEKGEKILTKICTLAWNEGKIPNDWKIGVIVPIFKKGNITSYGDTRRHENKCEELTLSDQDEHSPSKSTTTESQVTVRSSPIVPETVQVCRQCHKNCLSNVIANNKLNQTNHVRDCNSNQQSNHLFNDHNHFSERHQDQQSKQKEDSDWQPLLLLGLCANPVASLVKMDPFQSAAPKISVAPPTPEHSMANGTVDCFEGEDKCPCDHINNCCPMDKTQSVYDPDISPDDSPQTEDHPYHSLTSSVLTLRRFGTVSSLERCGSEEREDNNRNHYSSEESDIDDDHDHDDDDEDLGIDNEAFQHSSIMSWTVKAGSYVAEKMAFFERLGEDYKGAGGFFERYLKTTENHINGEEAQEEETSGATSGEEVWGTPTSGGDLDDPLNSPNSPNWEGKLSPNAGSISSDNLDDTEIMMDELLMAPPITGAVLRGLLPRRTLEPLIEEDFSETSSSDSSSEATSGPSSSSRQGIRTGSAADTCSRDVADRARSDPTVPDRPRPSESADATTTPTTSMSTWEEGGTTRAQSTTSSASASAEGEEAARTDCAGGKECCAEVADSPTAHPSPSMPRSESYRKIVEAAEEAALGADEAAAQKAAATAHHNPAAVLFERFKPAPAKFATIERVPKTKSHRIFEFFNVRRTERRIYERYPENRNFNQMFSKDEVEIESVPIPYPPKSVTPKRLKDRQLDRRFWRQLSKRRTLEKTSNLTA